MHNFLKNNGDFKKVLEGLQGARNLLKSNLTDEIKEKMNDEQLAELERAMEMSDPKMLKAKAMNLMNTIKR